MLSRQVRGKEGGQDVEAGLAKASSNAILM